MSSLRLSVLKAIVLMILLLLVAEGLLAKALSQGMSDYVLRYAKRLKSEDLLRDALSVFLSAGDLENAYIVSKVGTEKFPKSLFWWKNLMNMSLWIKKTKEVQIAFVKVYQLSKLRKVMVNKKRFLRLALLLNRFGIAKEIVFEDIKKGKFAPLNDLIYIYENAGCPFELMNILKKRYEKTGSKDVLIALIHLYYRYGKIEEAINLIRPLEKGKKLSVKEALVYCQLLYAMKRYDNALLVLKNVMRRAERKDIGFWKTLSDLSWLREEYELGTKASYILYEMKKARVIDYRRLYRFCLYQKKDNRLAMKFAIEGYNKFKNFNFISDFLYAASLTNKWGEIVETVKSLNPADFTKLKEKPYLLEIYLSALLKTGHVKEASSISKWAVRKGKLKPYQVILLADLYFKAGARQKAISILEDWTAKHLDISVLEHLSYLYQRLGERKKVKHTNQIIVSILEERNVSKSKDLRLLLSYARALKNLEKPRARVVYERVLKLKGAPVRVYLDYLDTLPKGRWEKYLDLIRKEAEKGNIDKDLKINLAFKEAEYLAYKGKYKEAVKRILPYEEIPENRLYAALFHNIANEWDKAKQLSKKITCDPYYTAYEKKMAIYYIMDIDRFWKKYLSIYGRLISNKAYGRRMNQIYSELKIPYKEWGFIRMNAYTFFNNNDNNGQHYKISGKSQGSVSIHSIENLYDKWLLALLYTDTKVGMKGMMSKHRENYHLEISGYLNDVEKEETSLFSIFSLKSGVCTENYYKPSRKFITGIKARYDFYYFPSSGHFTIKHKKSKNYDYLGYIFSLEPYIVYAQRDISPTVQHGFGFLYEKGHRTDVLSELSLPDAIPDFLYMPYYSISGMYFWGERKNIFTWGLAIGYMWGKRYSAMSYSPYLNIRYNIVPSLDIVGSAEYRRDTISNTGELRTRLGLEWRF